MSHEPKPDLFWQGMLIVLPVLALAAAGGVSLWQDRETVTLEARRAAGQFGEPLAAFLEEELGEALRAENERMSPERNGESDLARVWARGNRIDSQGNLVQVGPLAVLVDLQRVKGYAAALRGGDERVARELGTKMIEIGIAIGIERIWP